MRLGGARSTIVLPVCANRPGAALGPPEARPPNITKCIAHNNLKTQSTDASATGRRKKSGLRALGAALRCALPTIRARRPPQPASLATPAYFLGSGVAVGRGRLASHALAADGPDVLVAGGGGAGPPLSPKPEPSQGQSGADNETVTCNTPAKPGPLTGVGGVAAAPLPTVEAAGAAIKLPEEADAHAWISKAATVPIGAHKTETMGPTDAHGLTQGSAPPPPIARGQPTAAAALPGRAWRRRLRRPPPFQPPYRV